MIYNGSVDSWEEWIELSKKGYTEVTGNFYDGFSTRRLVNLKGSPIKVGGDFSIVNRGLSSLEGIPKYIGRNCILSGNNLKNTSGLGNTEIGWNLDLNSNSIERITEFPKKLKGALFINKNKLTRIEKFPSKFFELECNFNQISSFDGSLKQVEMNLRCSNNKLRNLKGFPNSIGGILDISSNLLESLEGLPKKIELGIHLENNRKQFRVEEVLKATRVPSDSIGI